NGSFAWSSAAWRGPPARSRLPGFRTVTSSPEGGTVKKSLAIIGFAMLAVLITLAPTASVGAAPRPSSYTLPGSAVFPEGVAYQSTTGNFFVSSTTDGSVLRGNVMEPAAAPFIAGGGPQFSAVGVKVDDARRLFVAGGVTGEVRAYDAQTGSLSRPFRP